MFTSLPLCKSSGLTSVRLLGAAFLIAAATPACKDTRPPELTLQVGPEQVIQFRAKSAFAHYFEFPGQEDILRIIVASYDVGCQEYRSPEPGEVFITVTIKLPTHTSLEPGNYEWLGGPLVPPDEADSELSDLEEDETEPRAVALPFVRLAEDARLLPPGGKIKLTTFERSPFGRVTGEFAFHDGGEGEAATTALLGEFDLRLCHIDLDPTRKPMEKKK